MAQTNLQTRSGNRVQIEFDGKQVGLVQSVRGSDNYGLDPASGIGDIHVIENVPTVARHTLAVSTMVLMKKNMRQQGLFPENGDAVLKGIVFDIVEYDKDTNKPMRSWLKCSYDSGDLDVTKHAIVMSSGTFFALDVTGTDA